MSKKKKEKEKHFEDYDDVEQRAKRLEALINLSNDIRDIDRRQSISFNDFLYLATEQPHIAFRNIFQLFHDMVKHYIPDGRDEYEITEDTIGFYNYDFHKLFVEGCDDPFFADRLFANRFINIIDGLKKGIQNNRLYLFEGPPGSGKSTFLNNLLIKFQEYTRKNEGTTYKTYWRLDVDKLGGFDLFDKNYKSNIIKTGNRNSDENAGLGDNDAKYPGKYLEIPCPNNDHPILQIPKIYRKSFLDELIPDGEFKKKLFTSKEYEWILKDIPCSLCKSIYDTLIDKLDDPLEVFTMLYTRKTLYNRQFGRGISVYNPGDQSQNKPVKNSTLQNLINDLLKTDEVKYVYSDLALTNNGVLALMDIKENNIDRLKGLHGIISDGVHKVEFIEENVKSLFFAIVNPEDKRHYEDVKSFQDRIITVNIPYVLDYNTEVSIYLNKFGREIKNIFLPRVLENFARIIISSRLEKYTPAIREWINADKYPQHVDNDLLLIKMDLYTGKIPSWLSSDDVKKFDRHVRKNVIGDSDMEGRKGVSGRQSLNIFNSFYMRYSKGDRLITMDMVKEFFMEDKRNISHDISDDFIESVERLYEYNILQEVKEAIYYYNEKQISRDIQNYLYSVNFELGETIKSVYTGDTIEVTDEYFKDIEAIFIGTTATINERINFRKDIQHTYISRTLSREMKVRGKDINETEQFKSLFETYINNLKENSLAPFMDNDNFRRAIKDYRTSSFNKYEDRLKRDVKFLISNLVRKFGYTDEGARQVSLYVLDKGLAKKY